MALLYIFLALFFLLVFLLLKRSLIIAPLFFLFVFTATWRMISTLYIDFYGPIESWELHRTIGGSNGWFSFVSLTTYGLVIIAILLVFNRTRVEALRKLQTNSTGNVTYIQGIRVEKMVTICFGVLMLLVYIELFAIGDLPFFTGEARWLYSRTKAGFFLKLYATFLGPLSWLVGYAFYIASIKKDKRLAKKILLLFFLSIISLILTGNKFSTPLYTVAIFALSPSTLLLANRRHHIELIRIRKIVVWILLFAAMFGFAIYKVFFLDRKYVWDYFLSFLEQRALLAPSQLVWGAYERVFLLGDWKPLEAVNLVFINPLPMDANPSVNYLMYRDLGPRVLDMSTGFTDAYPGIIFELFGPYMSFPIIFVFGLAFAFVLYKLAKYTVQQKFLHVTIFFFISQAFFMLHTQGQLKFSVSIVFYLKILLLILLMPYVRQRKVFSQKVASNEITVK